MAARKRPAPILGLLPALLALGVLGAVWGSRASAAPSEADARATFRRVTEAWRAEDARKITGMMARKGRLRLVLEAGSVRGSYGEPQARRVLQSYFGKVSAVRLKDVTPRDHKDDRSYRVRQFEYRYSIEGTGKGRGVLRVTLRADGKSRWVLVAVEESTRRRYKR